MFSLLVIQGLSGGTFLLLWAILCAGGIFFGSVTKTFSGPILALLLLFVLLLDLTVRSPLKTAQTLFFKGRSHNEALCRAFHKGLWQQSIRLRAILWKKRVILAMAVFFPSAWIGGCAALLNETASSFSLLYLLLYTSSFALTVCAALLLEWRMLHFSAAWIFLTEGYTAKEALDRSKKIIQKHAESAAKQRLLQLLHTVSFIGILPYFTTFPKWRRQSILQFQRLQNGHSE